MHKKSCFVGGFFGFFHIRRDFMDDLNVKYEKMGDEERC